MMASGARLALRYAIVVALVHGIVVSCSLVPGWRAIPLLAGDAPDYLKNAQNLAGHFVFSGADGPPFLWEAYRTPSYPLLIALSLFLSGEYQWVLYLAALTAGVAAWCGIRLVQQWNGSRLAAGMAGLAFALLPDSLGYSAHMLTDAVFGHLVLVWIYLLWTGLRSVSYSRLIGCAVLTVFLQGLKPVFNLAVVLLAVGGVLLARGRRQWLAVGLLAVSTIPAPLFFAIRNRQDHGVFSPTLLGVKTVREYLMTRYLAKQYRVNFFALREAIREEDRVKAAEMPPTQSLDGRLYLVNKEAVLGFLRDHPGAVVTLAFTEMLRQFTAPESRVFPLFANRGSRWVTLLGTLVTASLFAFAGYGGYRLWRGGDPRPSLLVMGVVLYFLATGSVAGLTGSRLRFPADMVTIPLAAIGFAGMIKRKESLPRGRRDGSDGPPDGAAG